MSKISTGWYSVEIQAILKNPYPGYEGETFFKTTIFVDPSMDNSDLKVHALNFLKAIVCKTHTDRGVFFEWNLSTLVKETK